MGNRGYFFSPFNRIANAIASVISVIISIVCSDNIYPLRLRPFSILGVRVGHSSSSTQTESEVFPPCIRNGTNGIGEILLP